MKIAILNCLKANEVCSGAGCLKSLNARRKHFEPYANEPVELIAFARFVSEGAEVCHVGVCTVRRETGQECPTITQALAYLEERGLKTVRGTH